MRLKYISKSSKTNKSSQSSGGWKPSFSTLGLAQVPKHANRASPKRTHRAASSPGRAWALYWCFFGPQRANLPIVRSTRRSRLQCVTKGKMCAFSGNLVGRLKQVVPQASTHWRILSGRPSERVKDTSFRFTLNRLALSQHELHSKSHGESFR